MNPTSVLQGVREPWHRLPALPACEARIHRLEAYATDAANESLLSVDENLFNEPADGALHGLTRSQLVRFFSPTDTPSRRIF